MIKQIARLLDLSYLADASELPKPEDTVFYQRKKSEEKLEGEKSGR